MAYNTSVRCVCVELSLYILSTVAPSIAGSQRSCELCGLGGERTDLALCR